MVLDFGHFILQVGNVEEALRLYRDSLGFELIPERSQPVWTVLKTKGGELTLYQPAKVIPLVLRDGENAPLDSPLELHVANFEEAADHLEKKGYKVKRSGKHDGTLIDPWGNRVRLHDHRES